MVEAPEELKTVQERLEQARNIQTLVEHDTERLKRLKKEQEASIGEDRKVKSELEETNNALERKKQNLSLDISNLQKDKNEIIGQIKTSQKELASTREEKETLDNLIVGLKNEIQQENNVLEQKYKEMAEREMDIRAREESVEKKYAKIKELHDSLI